MKITILEAISDKLSKNTIAPEGANKYIKVIAEDKKRAGTALNITRDILPCSLELEDFKQEHLNDLVSSTMGKYLSINITLQSADIMSNRVPILFTYKSDERKKHYINDTFPTGGDNQVEITAIQHDGANSYLSVINTPLGTLIDVLVNNPLTASIEVR